MQGQGHGQRHIIIIIIIIVIIIIIFFFIVFKHQPNRDSEKEEIGGLAWKWNRLQWKKQK